MMFNEITKEIEWNGERLIIETGKIARQADGAVMVRMGDSAVLCTAVYNKNAREDADFFALTVGYQERLASVGKIPGGFMKREGKASEKETLVSRLIDRPIRPLFPAGFFNETQVICSVYSADPRYSTDILAMIGASAALAISGAPFQEIIAGARVGYIAGEYVLNPSVEQLEDSELDLVVAGTKDSVMMVESEAKMLPEEIMLKAVEFGHSAFAPVIKMIEELKAEVNTPAFEYSQAYPLELKDKISNFAGEEIRQSLAIKTKLERYAAADQITEKVKVEFGEDEAYSPLQIKFALSDVKADIMRGNYLSTKERIDGRQLSEIRDIACEVGLFANTHGSALFTRGETQALVSVTLGTGNDEQIVEGIDGEYRKHFMLDYNFPPFSVGEAYPLKPPSRREIGHGKLAWRALRGAMPEKDIFPYTIRAISDVTESNGSSSMATVCGSSMAMMNAGVPLEAPIAGIAMGLIKEQKDYVILSDIIADEDHLGDMDFKVAGSSEGITALQMDIKVAGITFEIMKNALETAKEGRIHILGKMADAITVAGQLNDNAPVIESFMVNKDKIRDIIGPGGKVIREICDTTSAKIDIDDDGKVSVSAVGRENLESAIKKIKEIAIDPEVGDKFEGKVVKIIDSGAFVNLYANRDGFVHISEVAEERIKAVSDKLSEGDIVKVKVIRFERGKLSLTIKNADKEVAPATDKPKSETNNNKDNSESSARPERSSKKPEKREGAKKWKASKKPEIVAENVASGATGNDGIREKKYFS